VGDYRTDFVHFVSVESRLARSINSTFHWPVDLTRLHRQTIDSISRLDRFWGLPLIKAETAFKKIKYGENDFQYGRWNYYTLQCGTIMTLISPWLHPAMWHVALESWQWIHQVAAPCIVIHGSGMTCHWIRPVTAPCNVTRSSGIMTLSSPVGSTLQCVRWLWDDMPLNSPKRPPYWNSTYGFDFD